jgi:hypothetical protein
MKWLCALVPLFVVGSQAIGQAPTTPPPAASSSMPVTVIPEANSVTEPVLPSGATLGAGDGTTRGTSGFSNFIGFMSDPTQNVDPRALNELYPIFGSTWTTSAGILPSADVQLYGAGLTLALSDRLAVGLNQGGYANVQLSKKEFPILSRLDPRFANVEIGGNRSGWLDLGGFVQYTLIADEEDQFLLTGGLRWVAPCGSHEIFQGKGPADLAPYVTVGKGFGCYHFLGAAGYQFAAESGHDFSDVFYGNVHLDRQCFGWLYPLVEVNSSWHTSSVGIDLPVQSDFFDLDNFEASGDIVTLAVGFNAVLQRDRLEIGAAYSTPLYTRNGFNFSGLLIRMTVRF